MWGCRILIHQHMVSLPPPPPPPPLPSTATDTLIRCMPPSFTWGGRGRPDVSLGLLFTKSSLLPVPARLCHALTKDSFSRNLASNMVGPAKDLG